jgi:hypothetical protein
MLNKLFGAAQEIAHGWLSSLLSRLPASAEIKALLS